MGDITEEQLTQAIEDERQQINENRDSQFKNLETRLTNRIVNLEQLIKGQELPDDLDHIQPYDRDISMETRPQLSSADLGQFNNHVTHLSNHELHRVKSMYEKDHKKEIRTILDEPLGVILDKTLNFLVYSFDEYQKKIYEAELMEKINADDTSSYSRMKVYLIAMILFFRDDRNIIYIGFIMIFLSILIYFINIITIQI